MTKEIRSPNDEGYGIAASSFVIRASSFATRYPLAASHYPMSIWDLCIKRPVFTVMLVSAPLVLGIVSYGNLGVDLFPNVELPVVVVTTTLKGTSVEEMETSVTKPLEEIINTVNGIDELRSTTKEGISLITVQFFLEKNRDVAAQEVRDKISTIMAQLPQGIDPADHRQVRHQRHAGDDDRRLRQAGRCRRSPRSRGSGSRKTWKASPAWGP